MITDEDDEMMMMTRAHRLQRLHRALTLIAGYTLPPSPASPATHKRTQFPCSLFSTITDPQGVSTAPCSTVDRTTGQPRTSLGPVQRGRQCDSALVPYTLGGMGGGGGVPTKEDRLSIWLSVPVAPLKSVTTVGRSYSGFSLILGMNSLRARS